MRRFFKFRSLLLVTLFGFAALQTTAQTFFYRDTFCSNQLIIVNGRLYGPDNPTGTEVIAGGAANGADSIIEVRLVFFQPAILKIEQVICGKDTLWINNKPYHAGFTLGEETIEGGAANGCDSIIQVRLTPALAPVATVTDTLCPGAFILVNGVRYDENRRSGVEIFSGAGPNTCDSIVQINLFFPSLQIDLGGNQNLISGDTLCLAPEFSFHPVALEWSPTLPCAQTDCLPICQPFFANTSLKLTATDANGCQVTTEIQIRVNPEVPVYAPNIFSPEAGWPNNRFFLSAAKAVQVFKTMQIASRWGELIWERRNLPPDDPDAGWDGYWKGSLAPPGVYVFWAEYDLGDGQQRVVSGAFTLFR